MVDFPLLCWITGVYIFSASQTVIFCWIQGGDGLRPKAAALFSAANLYTAGAPEMILGADEGGEELHLPPKKLRWQWEKQPIGDVSRIRKNCDFPLDS